MKDFKSHKELAITSIVLMLLIAGAMFFVVAVEIFIVLILCYAMGVPIVLSLIEKQERRLKQWEQYKDVCVDLDKYLVSYDPDHPNFKKLSHDSTRSMTMLEYLKLNDIEKLYYQIKEGIIRIEDSRVEYARPDASFEKVSETKSGVTSAAPDIAQVATSNHADEPKIKPNLFNLTIGPDDQLIDKLEMQDHVLLRGELKHPHEFKRQNYPEVGHFASYKTGLFTWSGYVMYVDQICRAPHGIYAKVKSFNRADNKCEVGWISMKNLIKADDNTVKEGLKQMLEYIGFNDGYCNPVGSPINQHYMTPTDTGSKDIQVSFNPNEDAPFSGWQVWQCGQLLYHAGNFAYPKTDNGKTLFEPPYKDLFKCWFQDVRTKDFLIPIHMNPNNHVMYFIRRDNEDLQVSHKPAREFYNTSKFIPLGRVAIRNYLIDEAKKRNVINQGEVVIRKDNQPQDHDQLHQAHDPKAIIRIQMVSNSDFKLGCTFMHGHYLYVEGYEKYPLYTDRRGWVPADPDLQKTKSTKTPPRNEK